MATNFRDSSGTDFDGLFDPYVQGPVPPATGLRTSDGTDLAGRYAPLSYGSKRADVNYRTSAGTDVTNLWAAKGTAVYSLPFNGKIYSAQREAPSGSTGSLTASRSISFKTDGTWTIPGTGILTNGGPVSGTWLPSGQAAGDYEVQFSGTPVFTSYTAGGSSSNGAPSYAALTTTHAYQIAGTINAATAQYCIGSVNLTVNLRRVSTGTVTTSTVILQVDVMGAA